ncbi:MAG: hypothetical protein ACKV19_18215 [Verrucomicrobiales bacterium]
MKPRLLIVTILLTTTAARAQTSTFGGESYAWAGNIGWIELRPDRPVTGDGIVVADTHLSGYAWSANCGWINFGDGTPGASIRYSNTTGTDSGVNHDGAGNLSGLAWSANCGWINFGWAAPADPSRPRFSLLTGAFTGYAWASNLGWITLGTGLLTTGSMCVPDSDADGLSDHWERQFAGTLAVLTATGDSDGDGASDLAEYHADTNPTDPLAKFDILNFQRGATASTLTWTSRPTRLYRLELSQDLSAWSDSLLGLISPDAGATTTRAATHADLARCFFQVEPILPLSGVKP